MPMGSWGQVQNAEALKDPAPGTGSAWPVFDGACFLCLPSEVRPII